MRNDNRAIQDEKIELTLPVNAAYVSAARLTASSISNRMGFNIEDIEDIKAAVSEACIFLINQCIEIGEKNFCLIFYISQNKLEINLTVSNIVNSLKTYDKQELGIMMIKALMDNLDISIEENNILIKMDKSKK